MNRLRSAALVAVAGLTLAAGAGFAQTKPQTAPKGSGMPTEPRGPAPANPSTEPEQAGAIRYQGDEHGEKESEAKGAGKGAQGTRASGESSAPIAVPGTGRTKDEGASREKKRGEERAVPPRDVKP